jgi:hypothetical protein
MSIVVGIPVKQKDSVFLERGDPYRFNPVPLLGVNPSNFLEYNDI